MSTLAPARPKAILSATSHCEAMADFVHWAVAQLRAIDSEASTPEAVDLDELSVAELMAQLRAAGPAVHVRPSDQPIAVADVTSRLFDAYCINDGQVQLAGCQLADVPFVRLTFAVDDDFVGHVFVSQDGDVVPTEVVELLGLMNLEPISANPSRIDAAAEESLIAAGRRAAATTAEPLAAALVWTVYVAGKLEFTIGKTTAELPFEDWAQLLKAPPFVGPHSCSAGHHLAATDDGRVDLASAIAACEHSGRRVIKQELVTCCVTGKHVLPEFTDVCPVAGASAVVDQFAICAVCRERVSKAVLDGQTCSACCNLVRVRKDDPRLFWIQGAHPGLARWRRWRLAETCQAYIARADGPWNQLLVVVDKPSLTVRHLATANRLSRTWRTVSSAEKEKLLT